jgi:alpha-methylacyl-CoA racemase
VSTAGGPPGGGGRHWTTGLTVGSPASMALRDELAALLASRPLEHWATVFERVDACVTPVLRLDETLQHPVFSPSGLSTNT